MILLYLVFSLSLFAKTTEVSVLHVEDRFIKFDNGEVGWPSPLHPLSKKLKENQRYLIELDSQNTILSARILPNSFKDKTRPLYQGKSYYRPTVLPNYSATRKILERFNDNYGEDSQCYDRAQVWAYEEYIRSGLKSMKAFLFFSDSYIVKYKYKWWFHVAPYVHLSMDNEITERVLDPRFSSHPLKFKIWSDLFVLTRKECQVIRAYQEYVNGSQDEDCYLLKQNMFYWQPRDLEEWDKTHETRYEFVKWEVQHAYKAGFGLMIPN